MRHVGWTVIAPNGELRRGTTGTYANKLRFAPPKIYATKGIASRYSWEGAKVVRVFVEDE